MQKTTPCPGSFPKRARNSSRRRYELAMDNAHAPDPSVAVRVSMMGLVIFISEESERRL